MNFKLSLFALLFLISTKASADSFRIIGYLPTYRFSTIEALEVEKLTHLNLAFGQTSSDGFIQLKGNYEYVIQRAKEKNPDLRVLLSLAGGGLSSVEFTNWKKNMAVARRSDFIHNILLFVKNNNFDGVDVDLEWNNVTADYPGFVTELSDSMRSNKLEISAAFPAMKLYKVMANQDLNIFDYINIMAYDNSGPWQPKVVKQHSSFDLAEKSIDFWSTYCNLPKDKINLGIPCYGYDFGVKSVKSKTFANIISTQPELAFSDNIQKTFYNSIPTVIEKTRLAKERCGGVMLWEIGQDALGDKGDYSLLHYVHNTALTDGGNFLPKLKKFNVIQTEGNMLSIHLENDVAPGSYFVLQDIVGCANEKIDLCHPKGFNNFNLGIYPRGVYVISLVEPGFRTISQKIMKLKS